VQTDADGRFELTGLPRWNVRFDFLRDGFDELRDQTLEPGGVHNEVRMVGGGAIRGRVLDPDGKPVRDFRIRLDLPRNLPAGEKSGGFYAGYQSIGITFTANDGTFAVSDVPADTWLRVRAVATGYGEAINDRVLALPIDELPAADPLTLRLTRPHQLRVRVVSEQDQKPLADALVTLLDGHPQRDEAFSWGYHNMAGLRGWTDRQGWADFSTLAFNEAAVLVECPGYAHKRFGWRQQEEGFEVSLAPQAVIKGIVQKEGLPLRQYQVSLKSAAGDSYYFAVWPEDRGGFLFDQLPQGDYTLELLNEPRLLHKQILTLKPGQIRELTLDTAKLPAGSEP
jgi:hypothetical protein